MDTEKTLFWLPTPIFWGVIAAWIPIPPSILVGCFFAIITYALLSFLVSLREWDEYPSIGEAPEPLIPKPDSKPLWDLTTPNLSEVKASESWEFDRTEFDRAWVPTPIRSE